MNIILSESSNIVAHIGLGDLQSPEESRQDTRNNSLTASNDGGLSDGLNGGYSRGRPNPYRPALTHTGSLQTENTR